MACNCGGNSAKYVVRIPGKAVLRFATEQEARVAAAKAGVGYSKEAK
jgi:hypothetical protein